MRSAHPGKSSPPSEISRRCSSKRLPPRKTRLSEMGTAPPQRRQEHKSTGPPFVKKAEYGIQLPISKLALQVCRSGLPRDSEREVCTDHRPRRCDCCILVPGIAVGGGENCRQDVGTSKCRQRRAIEYRQEEKPQRSQVAEHRGKTASLRRSGISDEDLQHERNISQEQPQRR